MKEEIWEEERNILREKLRWEGNKKKSEKENDDDVRSKEKH